MTKIYGLNDADARVFRETFDKRTAEMRLGCSGAARKLLELVSEIDGLRRRYFYARDAMQAMSPDDSFAMANKAAVDSPLFREVSDLFSELESVRDKLCSVSSRFAHLSATGAAGAEAKEQRE